MEEEEEDNLPTNILNPTTSTRKICTTCNRPTNVCLCAFLPLSPLSNTTQVVVLHHPHEQKHKLNTVPILQKCLANCHVVVGRRLRKGKCHVLDLLYDDAVKNPDQPKRAAYLFPGTESIPASEIGEWKSSLPDCLATDFVLVAFDGTWKHAKEMVDASLPFLSKFSTRVCLTYDAGIDGGTMFDSDLILRKEPFSGCLSTLEAVARALRIIEPNGTEIEGSLVKVLQAMVRFQSGHLKPTKPRPKLLKSGKELKK